MEGPGYHSHLGGRDRAAEPVHHIGPVRGLYPLQELGLLQTEILGMEQEVPLGVAIETPAPYFEYNPPWRGPAPEEEEEALLDFDLEALLELGPEVNCFLQGLADSLGRRIGRGPPQNLLWRI